MFSIFKRQIMTSDLPQALLDENELLMLRQQAEQLDCSFVPSHILESRKSGSSASSALGSGINYAESRVYQAGDDVRSINWRLSARSHETFVKTFHVESKPSMSVCLDRRRSMVFGTCKRLKITQAVRVASLLAFSAMSHQLDFQAWILDENTLQHTNDPEDFLGQINKPCSIPVMTSDTNQKGVFSLREVFDNMAEQGVIGSLVYLLSDFNHLTQYHQASLARLYEKSFVQAVHIADKGELSLPKMGKIRLQDMYKDRDYQLDTSQKKRINSFKLFAENDIDKKKEIITDIGIAYSLIETDKDTLHNCIYLPLGQI